jgi:hypothetical protein
MINIKFEQHIYKSNFVNQLRLEKDDFIQRHKNHEQYYCRFPEKMKNLLLGIAYHNSDRGYIDYKRNAA